MFEAISDFAYLFCKTLSILGMLLFAVICLTASVFCFLFHMWTWGLALVMVGMGLLFWAIRTTARISE